MIRDTWESSYVPVPAWRSARISSTNTIVLHLPSRRLQSADAFPHNRHHVVESRSTTDLSRGEQKAT